MTVFTAINASPLVYVPSDVTAHANQRYNVFVPPSPWVMPKDGWPVLIQHTNTGFQTTAIVSSLDTSSGTNSFMYIMLQLGAVVLSVSSTTSQALGNDYGAPNHGLGLWHAPGTTGEFEDVTYPMCEKDAMYILQCLRKNAANINVGGTAVKINPNRIFTNGTSGGAYMNLLSALGPDRISTGSNPLGSASTDSQYGFSTRPNGAVFRLCNPDLAYFDGTQSGVHFKKSGTSETPAVTVSQCDASYLATYALTTNEDAALNAAGTGTGFGNGLKWIWVTGDPNIGHVFVSPYDAGNKETSVHSSLGCFVWKTKYQQYTRVVNQALQAIYSPAPFAAERTLTDLYLEDTVAGQFPEAVMLAQMMGTLPVWQDTLDGWPEGPVPPFDARLTQGTTASASDETGVLPDDNRRQGCWVCNVSNSASVAFTMLIRPGIVGDGGTAYIQLRPTLSTACGPKSVFVPGNAGIVVKRSAGSNTSWAIVEI